MSATEKRLSKRTRRVLWSIGATVVAILVSVTLAVSYAVESHPQIAQSMDVPCTTCHDGDHGPTGS